MNQAGTPVRLIGVDVAGTEQGCALGTGLSYAPMTQAEANSIAAWDANAVRVPLNEDCWLGINGVKARYSGSNYVNAITQWVQEINQAGMIAVLDLHWSAPGAMLANRQWPMPDADHSIAFWNSVASHFASTPGVMFDLYNEPALGRKSPTAADWACWRNGCPTSGPVCPPHVQSSTCPVVSYQIAGMQQLLDAVRSAGATQPVLAEGLDWAADLCGNGVTVPTASTCTWLTNGLSDPDHALVASVHIYEGEGCSTATCWTDQIGIVAKSAPVVTGEFGSPECSSAFVESYMNWADANNVSYLAWSWTAPKTPLAGCGATHANDLLSNYAGSPRTSVGAEIKSHYISLGARAKWAVSS